MSKDWINVFGTLGATLILAALPLHAAEQSAAPAGPTTPGTLTLAKFDKAPEIDGKIGADEWAKAARLEGFLGGGGSSWGRWHGRGWLEPRRGHALVGFTADQLYITIVTELPPDGELMTRQDRDEAVRTVFDDSIEIWIANPEFPETQYQFMTNAKGVVFDIKHAQAGSDQAWDGDWKVASRVDKDAGVWICEMSTALSTYDYTGDPTGGAIKVLIARNFKRPWQQAAITPNYGSFRTPDGYAHLRLTANDPVVRIEGVGEYGGGQWGPVFEQANLKLDLAILNPGPARKARVTLKTYSTDMPSRDEDKTIDLPAGGKAQYTYEIPSNHYHADAAHMINYQVTDADTGEILMATGFMWSMVEEHLKSARETTWLIQSGPQPNRATGVAYYPSYDRLRVMVDPSYLGDEFKGGNSAEITVADQAGKTVLQRTITWEEDKTPAEQWVEIPDLADGRYTATFKLDGYDKPLIDNFARKKFPWEGNRLGYTDEPVAPFTPITVDGNTVGVVLREYEMSGLGLWKSVRAKGQDENEGLKDLLTGPIELIVDGKQALEGKGKFTSKASNRVVYEGAAQHPAVSASIRSIIEEDGCMRVELTLAPGTESKELKSLTLRIPMLDKMAPLYHVSSTTLRTNPAGATPSGQGKVWNSYDYPVAAWYDNFHPYIWLGAEARGLCWFADNDKGWVVDYNEKTPEAGVPPQELHREGDTLTLNVNLVQKPVKLEGPRTIVFGLMASPGKPMRPDWRAYGRSDHQRVVFNMSLMYGTGASYSSKYPLNADFGTFDFVQAERRGKDLDEDAFAKEWIARAAHPDMPEEMKQTFINTIARGLGRGRSILGKEWSVYFDEFHSTSIFMKEAPYYFSEWSGRYAPNTFPEYHTSTKDYRWGFPTLGIVDSFRDFAAWYGAEWIKRGVGLYFDNANPRADYDPVTSAAYVLDNGDIQPSAGMWARREYMRRIWTLHRQLTPADTPGAMMIHMTNTHIVPYMTWNDVNLDLEWKRSNEPIQSKFSPELLRAETLGLQTGTTPTAFDTVGRDQEASRISELALLVHEAKVGLGTKPYPKVVDEFGYGLPDCTVVDYWDEQLPIQVSDEQCKFLLLERGGKKMVILATWNREPAEVTLRFDATPASATDAESGEALQVRDGAVIVPMNAYGARVVTIQ